MLVIVLLLNIGLILASTTAREPSTSLEGQKNVSTLLDDYVDYGIEQAQTSSDSSEAQYSFPFEEERSRAGILPTLVDNGRRQGVHRRPLTPKSSAEQVGVFLVEEPRSNHQRNGLPAERSRSSLQRERSRPEVDKYPVFYNNGRPAHSMGYSYAGYIQRQAKRYPIMMYTLVQCVPCQRAKHLLAVNYADVAAYFLELVGHEDWQRQLQVDLHRMTGQITFPYIFICGRHIGGASDLFELHQNGQLRSTLNNCT